MYAYCKNHINHFLKLGLFYGNTGLFSEYRGLFCRNTGLFFWEYNICLHRHNYLWICTYIAIQNNNEER